VIKKVLKVLNCYPKNLEEKGDVAQNHQYYFALSSFRIAMAMAEAPTPI
jgi:hypothetical protein